MAKLFVPLDVDFATDPKILAAGPMASYLYVCSLAYCKRTAEPGRDGVVDREHLRVLAIGLPGKPEKYAAQLVAAGLWAPHHDGWIIPSWLKRNPSAVKLDKKRAQQKAKSILGNHEQHHVAKRKPSLDCILCFPEHDDDDTPQGDLIRSLLRSLQGSRTPLNGEPHGEPHGEADFVPNRTGREQEENRNRKRTGTGREQEENRNRKRTGTGREPEPEENSPSSSPKLTLVAPERSDDDEGRTLAIYADLQLRTEQQRPDRTEPITHPTAWKRACATDARNEHGDAIRRHLANGYTPDELALWLITGTLAKAQGF